MFIAMPILFIGNSYRKQLFNPFISANLFGRRPYIYLTSTRLLNCNCIEALVYKMLLRIAHAVIISDDEGAKVLDKYPLEPSKKILWFCWNGADDLTTWPLSKVPLYPHLKMCFVFSDETKKAESLFKLKACHLKYPILQKHGSKIEKRYLISYVGEVDTVDELEKSDKEINDYLWELTEQFTSNGNFENNLNIIDERRARSQKTSFQTFLWILRNRIRHKYVKALKHKFAKDFLLVGNDWKKYGLDSLPSDYNSDNRFKVYKTSKLCLDLLSKSSLDAQYPRSAEIISHSNGIIQLKTVDSLDFFGDQWGIRTFQSLSDLNNKIENLLAMNDTDFEVLGEKLRTWASTRTHGHNLAQIQR